MPQIAPNPDGSMRINMARATTYETHKRTLYALYQANEKDKDVFFYNGDVPVCLVSIIHLTGEIRWHVPISKSMEQQDEEDRQAIEHFDLGY